MDSGAELSIKSNPLIYCDNMLLLYVVYNIYVILIDMKLTFSIVSESL